MLAETDWVPVLTQLGAFVVILGGVVIGVMKQLSEMRKDMKETKEAVDGSITAWKADRARAEEERLKAAEIAAHAAGAKDAKDKADDTAAQVREALEAARKERAQSVTLADPDATAEGSGVPLQDLRVVEQPDKES